MLKAPRFRDIFVMISGMEIWLFVVSAALFAGIVYFISSSQKSNTAQSGSDQKKVYSYTAKSQVMTPFEVAFFKRLVHITEGRYLVFPQMHLSAFIDHKVKGQNWNAAFRHINSKSVDYLLCDVITFESRYAVELDDWTHDRNDRIERDNEVERILSEAGIPLVRFVNIKSLSDAEIVLQFSEAKAQAGTL